MQRTLSILKPDAVERQLMGEINERFKKAGLSIIAQKQLHITYSQAMAFYAVHKDRPFFHQLCQYISQGTIIVQVLEGKDAIMINRQLMGATDPAKADPGTIRHDLGQSIERNTVHGSDSEKTAEEEINFFFGGYELIHAQG
jgi:nucleoside-diphosphate kinase